MPVTGLFLGGLAEESLFLLLLVPLFVGVGLDGVSTSISSDSLPVTGLFLGVLAEESLFLLLLVPLFVGVGLDGGSTSISSSSSSITPEKPGRSKNRN